MIQSHWPQILAGLGTLYAVLSFINGLLKHPGAAKTVVGKAMDDIAFLTRSDSPGTLKAPGTPSADPAALVQP